MFRFCRRALCKPAFSLTLNETLPGVAVQNKVLFESQDAAACTVYSNESFSASSSFHAQAVWLNLNSACGWFGVFPAALTEPCRNHRLGTTSLAGSVACRVGDGKAVLVSNDKELLSTPLDCAPPVLLDVSVKNGVASFRVDGKSLSCAALSALNLQGELRVGVSTGAAGQMGALAVDSGRPVTGPSQDASLDASDVGVTVRKFVEDLKALIEAPAGGGEDGGSDDPFVAESSAPETGYVYTDPAQLKLDIEKDGPIVALTPTVFRCNEAQDGTVYVPVPIGTEETAGIGVSVRFTGIKKGYAGCGFFKKAALDSGKAHQCIVGKTEDSISCLLKNGEVFVFVNGKALFCGDTPDADELTMHFLFERNKGLRVSIGKGIVNCDEFKDMSLFSGDLYFAMSMSEEGQLARILPSGSDVKRFHYGMNSMDVDEDKLMASQHSVRASLSAHERWYGNAEKVFAMRITNVSREPIGIGLVSAKLWDNGRRNMVGGKEFGPHSIGLLIKDRRVYVHYQDEFVEWKPVGRMPPIAKSVDLVMRVSGGKVSFFYQGIPVIMPVISELTLPSDERFRVAYTMSDKGQTAVIPPNVAACAPDSVKQRGSLLGDAAHVKLAEDNRSAQALFAGALCLSSEAFAITPSPWAAYSQGCSGCEREDASGTLWLCPQCGASEEFALCDTCYWDAALASKHDHARNQFIPLFGTGLYEMHLTVEDSRNSYMEVGVAPAGYEDGFGAFAANTSVVLGQVPELVKCSMPASKFAAGCAALKSGDEVCLRVVGAALSVLVNGANVFETTLSADEPFMSQPLRFAVRMGCTGQKIRVSAGTPPQ